MRRNWHWVHQKIKKPKMLRMEFWTSEFDVPKWSKRPWDPHNRIRLEKLCPKVVSNRKMTARMTSKRRFWDFRPIHENQALNVNFSPSGHPPLSGPQPSKGGFFCQSSRGLCEIIEKGSKQPNQCVKDLFGLPSRLRWSLAPSPF